MDTHLMPETTIRYTVDNLGLIGREECVAKGELGRIIGPGPDEGWIYTEPAKYPGTICPVSAGMIEAA
jgi:hypothetical protein